MVVLEHLSPLGQLLQDLGFHGRMGVLSVSAWPEEEGGRELADPVIDQSQQRIHKGARGELAVHLRAAVLGEGIRQLCTAISAGFPRPLGGCVCTSSV